MKGLPGLEKRIIDKKTMLVFSSGVNDILKKEVTPASFMKALLKVIGPIREDMSKVENSFNGTFPGHCQERSVPT